MKSVIIFFLFYYVFNVVTATIKYIKLTNLHHFYVSKLKKMDNTSKKEFAELYNELVKQNPKFNDLVGFSNISYFGGSEPDFDIRNNYQQLLSTLDYSGYNLRKKINPLNSLKSFIFLPVDFINLFNIRMSKLGKLIITLLGWGIPYLLGLFGPEIKSLILAVFQSK